MVNCGRSFFLSIEKLIYFSVQISEEENTNSFYLLSCRSTRKLEFRRHLFRPDRSIAFRMESKDPLSGFLRTFCGLYPSEYVYADYVVFYV
jgi:hypothetical protein